MTVQQISVNFITRYSSRGVRQFQRDLATVGAASQAASGKAASGLHKVGIASRAAGTALLVGVGAALAVGIKAAIDFEDAFAGVRKTVDASEPQFQSLAEAIQRMSTQIPVSAIELAKIGELGGQLGVPVENLEEFIEIIAMLGATTNLSVDEAATAMARFTNIMGTPEDEISNVASALVDLGNNAAAQEDEILAFATRLAGIGVTVGLTEGEVLGLAAAFTSLGVAPERGATAIQRVFVAMLEAVQEGGEDLAIFAEIAGTTREEFAELFQLDPASAFLAFEEGLARVNQEGGQTTVLLDDLGLGSQRTLQAILAGANSFDILEEALGRGNQAYGENTALQDEFAERLKTTVSQVILLKNSFMDFVRDSGSSFLPAISHLTKVFIAFFEVLSENREVVNAFALAVIALGIGRGFKALKNLTSGIHLLGAFRLPKFVGAMNAADTAAAGFGTRMRFAWRQLGGFSGVITAAGLALGAIALAMAINKQRAKANQDAIRNLIQTIDDFEDGLASARDVYLAFNEALKQPNAILDFTVDLEDPDLRQALVEVGTTGQILVDLALNDPEEFERRSAEIIQGLTDDLNEVGEGHIFGTPEQVDAARRRLELVKEAIKEIREETELRRQEEALLAREQRIQTQQRIEDFHRLEMARIFGQPTPGGLNLPDFIPGFMGTVDEYYEILDDVTKETRDFAGDFLDEWDDIVGDLMETVLDWETAFDNFEETILKPGEVEEALGELTDSLNNWLVEQAQITEALRLIVGEFGAEAGRLFLALSPDIQGIVAASISAGEVEQALDFIAGVIDSRSTLIQEALERAFHLSPATANQFLTDVDEFIRTELTPMLAEQDIEPGTIAFDRAVSEGIAEAVQTILQEDETMGTAILQMLDTAAASAVDQFDTSTIARIIPIMTSDLTAAEKIQAFTDIGISYRDALALAFSTLPSALKENINPADIKFHLQGDEATLKGIGERWARHLAAGFQLVLPLLTGVISQVPPAIDEAARKGLKIESPSKVSMEWGEQVATGFRIGMGDMLNPLSHMKHFRMSQPIVNVSTPPSSVSRDLAININHPQHRSDDIISSLQESNVLATLTRFAETSPGAN